MRLATLSRSLPDDPDRLDPWREQITQLTEQKERLESELSGEIATFREAREEMTLETLLSSLPKGAMLVDFLEYTQSTPPREPGAEWDYEQSLLAFVVSHGDPSVVMFDLGPIAPLAEAIDTWRDSYGLSASSRQAGQRLRETIWQPLLPAIGDAETVIVSTDGALGRLPLGALPGRESGTFLLEDHRLALVPVPQLLPDLLNRSDSAELTRELLLVGDVDYDADPQGATEPESPRRLKPWERVSTERVRGEASFKPLANTAGEIATIGELYGLLYQPQPDAIVRLRGDSATEQSFREQAPQCYQLHIATHGFFADASKKSALGPSGEDASQRSLLLSDEQRDVFRGYNPDLLSGLAFAGANRPPQPEQDDGILTAQEIAFLPLEGVDLVTLSACETGLGEVAGGEGLIGVQRAFQVSGARTTIASLWKVDDLATRVLMERFYRNLWEREMSKLDALREAQLWVLNNPGSVRGADRDPQDQLPERAAQRYWAAFVLSGDWR